MIIVDQDLLIFCSPLSQAACDPEQRVHEARPDRVRRRRRGRRRQDRHAHLRTIQRREWWSELACLGPPCSMYDVRKLGFTVHPAYKAHRIEATYDSKIWKPKLGCQPLSTG